ncbi:MAG: Gldg family protein [Cyanobacteriota bacterium]|nr:Gldg family protein [Cyanobacteriota bacterium]
MKNSSQGTSELTAWSGIVGIAVVAVGLLLGSVFTGWTAAPLIIIGIGVALLLLWVVSHQDLITAVLGMRSTRSNVNGLVAALAMLLILALINVLAVRYQTKFDLTQEGLYTLSPQTTQLVRQLQQPVKVWVATTTPDPYSRDQLERYQRLNPNRFSFEFFNPNNSPERARQLEVKQLNTFVVESGSRRQQFPRPTGDLESTLTPTLAKVLSTTALTVYVVQGHGEFPLTPNAPGSPGLSQVVAGLEQDTYQVKPLNLIDSDIPADASVIIVAGPQRAYFPGEVDKLKTYLNQGGKLLLLLSPQVETGLEPLLSEWGVSLGNDVVVDVSEVSQLLGFGPSVALVNTYGSHPITEPLASQGLVTLFPLARSVTTTPIEGYVATPILTSSPKSWGETDLAGGKAQFDRDRDKPGPLTLGVALSHAMPPEEANSSSESTPIPPENQGRLVVIGNANFAVDGNFRQQGNGDLFLNSVNWLSEQAGQISIRPKSATNRRFSLSRQNLNGLVVVAMLGLPLLALGSGGYIWWQRR